MTLPATPLGMRQSRQRQATKCCVCHKPIEHPTWNQKVCAEKCADQWALKVAKKRKASLARKKDRARVGALKGTKPARSRSYLDFLRACRCIVCRITPCDPCHVGPIRGMRQKCSDFQALPMCRVHHDEQHKRQKEFWAHHSLDREALIAAFNLAYAELHQEGDRAGGRTKSNRKDLLTRSVAPVEILISNPSARWIASDKLS